MGTMFAPTGFSGSWSALINAFFLYSFLGWVMECIVIRREKGVWENRGFVHAPFCIIYGFGAMIGYAILRPFAHNMLLLYLIGAVLATAFEYFTALIMLRLFGNLWWDYSHKPLNYKGILCLESTIGWGFIPVLMFTFLHGGVFFVVHLVPQPFRTAQAIVLLAWYAIDFVLSVREALHKNAREKICQEAEAS